MKYETYDKSTQKSQFNQLSCVLSEPSYGCVCARPL